MQEYHVHLDPDPAGNLPPDKWQTVTAQDRQSAVVWALIAGRFSVLPASAYVEIGTHKPGACFAVEKFNIIGRIWNTRHEKR